MRRGMLLSALLLLPVSARAAVVYLKDGSRLQGTIVSATARDIKIDTADGTLRVNTDRILRVDYSEAPAQSAPAPAEPQPAAPAPPPPYFRCRWRAPSPEASFEERRQMFSIDLGLAAPLSGVDFSSVGGGSASNGAAGVLVGAQYVYYVAPQWGVGLDFNYFNRNSTDTQNLLPNSDTNVFGDSVVLLGIVRYTLTDHGWARPYILAGAGAHHTSTTIDATPDFGFSWSDTHTGETRRLVDDSSWGFAASARVGIDFHYYSPAFFSVEAGWTGLENGSYNSTPAGRAIGLSGVSGPLNVFTFAGRWGWRF